MYRHDPVLLQDVVQQLDLKPDGVYIDATFGRGGHSQAILTRLGDCGRLLAMDKDPDAANSRTAQSLSRDQRFSLYRGSFTQIEQFAKAQQVMGKVNGILLDLGVSSPQLEDPERGFSFLREGPLDMRMDPSQDMDAGTWVNQAPQQEIARVLKEYGEERFARRIAGAIVKARQQRPFETTTQLAEIIAAAHPAWEAHKHPATRSFQAIRIFVNRELDELEQALVAALDVLAMKGRLLVISFHSLEDRIVKRFIQFHERGGDILRGIPVKQAQLNVRMRRVGKAIRPNEAEVADNPRARSATLRVAEKLK